MHIARTGKRLYVRSIARVHHLEYVKTRRMKQNTAFLTAWRSDRYVCSAQYLYFYFSFLNSFVSIIVLSIYSIKTFLVFCPAHLRSTTQCTLVVKQIKIFQYIYHQINHKSCTHNEFNLSSIREIF